MDNDPENCKRTPLNSGITLLEIMVAMLIFSIGILGIGTVLIKAIGTNTKARRVTFESVAVTDLMEKILSLPYDDPLLMDKDDGFEPLEPDHGPISIQSPPSTIEWEIDDNFPAPNTKRIRITIRFIDHSGVKMHYTYEYIKPETLL